MINTLKIYEDLAQDMEDSMARRLASTLGLIYEDLQNTASKVEFGELRSTMQELTEAQKRSEQTINTLGVRMEELTEAQKRTEHRVDTLGVHMEELAEAQKRSERTIDTLGVRMEELAEAQKRTDQKMGELAEAQKRTDQTIDTLGVRMAELAETMKQTTQIVASLNRAENNTRQQVGGLARTMAYALENEAYRRLPGFLKAHYRLEVRERLIRAWINGEEINFYARARRGHDDVVIVGESVMRLDDGGKFGQLQRKLDAVRQVEALPLVPLLVTHFARPDLLDQARQQGVVVVQSFEWD